MECKYFKDHCKVQIPPNIAQVAYFSKYTEWLVPVLHVRTLLHGTGHIQSFNSLVCYKKRLWTHRVLLGSIKTVIMLRSSKLICQCWSSGLAPSPASLGISRHSTYCRCCTCGSSVFPTDPERGIWQEGRPLAWRMARATVRHLCLAGKRADGANSRLTRGELCPDVSPSADHPPRGSRRKHRRLAAGFSVAVSVIHSAVLEVDVSLLFGPLCCRRFPSRAEI